MEFLIIFTKFIFIYNIIDLITSIIALFSKDIKDEVRPLYNIYTNNDKKPLETFLKNSIALNLLIVTICYISLDCNFNYNWLFKHF